MGSWKNLGRGLPLLAVLLDLRQGQQITQAPPSAKPAFIFMGLPSRRLWTRADLLSPLRDLAPVTEDMMPRDPLQLTIPDVAQFAKTLRAGLSTPPSHLETLGLIARAAGYRNYQHMRARLSKTAIPAVDDKAVTRAARYFDADGLFARWPAKTGVQRLCLWALWAKLPARETLSEIQISARIHAMCSFRDAAQIRRAMVEHKMVTRSRDGSQYCRIEQQPPPEAAALIAQANRLP